MTKPAKSRAIELLTRAKDQIPTLRDLSANSPIFQSWRRDTKVSISKIFGDKSDNLEEFTSISYFPYIPVRIIGPGRPTRPTTHESKVSFEGGLNNAEWLLESMIREIKEHWVENEQSDSNPLTSTQLNSTRVFVVHGKDDQARSVVARLIEKVDLEAVILEEQPSRGRTVISKFQQESTDIGFAVVLLTPDDEGRLRGNDNDFKPRARQNVILELGYFLASLGQDRVCALTKGDVDIPSDYDGVIYISMDSGNDWKLNLVKELRAAGFNADANKI